MIKVSVEFKTPPISFKETKRTRPTHIRSISTDAYESPPYQDKFKGLQTMIEDISVSDAIRQGIAASSVHVHQDSMYKRLVLDVDSLLFKVNRRSTITSVIELQQPVQLKLPKVKPSETPALNRLRDAHHGKSKLGPGSYYNEPDVQGPAYGFGLTPRVTDLAESLECKD